MNTYILYIYIYLHISIYVNIFARFEWNTDFETAHDLIKTQWQALKSYFTSFFKPIYYSKRCWKQSSKLRYFTHTHTKEELRAVKYEGTIS